MNKQLHILAVLALVAGGAHAQQNTSTQQSGQQLHKEITLEKDFVPVEKKAVKKNVLPKVKRAATPAPTQVNYSTWSEPIDVPTTIPTMMPYGYRTAHIFSHKRGYLDMGGGMAANFVGSAGYRIIDKQNLTLGAWVQHSSTWLGKNSSKLILTDDLRDKQRFNDNTIGVDVMSRLPGGTLNVGARAHFDSFNYYGGTDLIPLHPLANYDSTQMFMQLRLKGDWDGMTTLGDHELYYNAGLDVSHAGYDHARPGSEQTSGNKENLLTITVGGDYWLNNETCLGLQITGDYVNMRRANYRYGGKRYPNDSYFLTTISPYFAWQNHIVRLHAGADLLLGNLHMREFHDISRDLALLQGDQESDTRVYISPDVQVDVKLSEGVALYADISGGKTINSLSEMAFANRYSDPNALYRFNSFAPFIGELGLKLGPFTGFSAKLYAGYGIFKGDMNVVVPGTLVEYEENDGYNIITYQYLPLRHTAYATFNTRGLKVGGELAYRYRSLIEGRADIVFAPGGDELKVNRWSTGYSLDGLDGAELISNINMRVRPIRNLAIDLGLELRCNRSVLASVPKCAEAFTYENVGTTSLNDYAYIDLDDAVNLHAGASWKFEKDITLWAKANNLLNRRYDVLPGMGTQKFNIMAGFSVAF